MATSTQTNEPVVFLLPDGTEVSNDPRFYEQKMRNQLLEQQRELLTKSAPNTGKATGPAPKGADTTTFTGRDIQNPGGSAEDETEDDTSADDYDSMTVDQLKAEAKEKDVDLTGVTKKSELIQRLRDFDASQG